MRKLFLAVPALMLLSLPAFGAMESRPVYPLCGGDKLSSCIEDGNTFWYGWEHMRLENVVPPTQQACAPGAATDRLFELLNHREIFVFRYGTDSEGHTLARVISDGQDVGQVLIKENLAQAGSGDGKWC
ncbi:MAG: hypothetical protein ABL879_09965 [Devosia sp.]